MRKILKVIFYLSLVGLLAAAVISCRTVIKNENAPADGSQVASGQNSSADAVTSSEDRTFTDEAVTPVPTEGEYPLAVADAAPTEKVLPTEEPTPTPKPYTVVLDPGHGGYDPGACSGKLVETELTLKIAEYCRDYLLTEYDSIEVYMTRTEDKELSRDKKEDLLMRCELARDTGADCLVSIHLNATDKHNLHGAEIYCSKRDNVGEATFALGNAIMDELVELGLMKREVRTRRSNDMFDEDGIRYDYYAINRHCANFDIPGIIVEAAFIDNEIDQAFLSTEEGLKAIGEADARGIAKYLGVETE